MAKFFRKKSKRMTCRKRFKIVKKVAEHKRKLRREQKKNPKKSKPKDPGVPNSLPFKDEIIREAEMRKERAKELRQQQKDERLKLQMKNRGLTELVTDAEKREAEFHVKSETLASTSDVDVNPIFKSYYKEFKQVIETADVILEVLDARDPLGTRCPQVEQAVISSGPNKRLVLVLNKVDLIPRNNLENWLKYLRQEFPTVAFKASTQVQNENLSHSKIPAIHMNEKLKLSSRCIGANFLMKLLGNYCRNQNIQTSIKVGIVGFPNVGKSSIINSLKRSRACTVGATPGVTKYIQEVQLDKHIRLLDSPGVVFAKDGSPSTLALRNAVKLENLKDTVTPAEFILQRANKEQLMTHYCIPEFSTSQELLAMLAKRIGRFKKGGIPDIESAARKLLTDWCSGKIKYYTHPPENHELPSHISAEYVKELGKPFDIACLEEEIELDKLPVVYPSDAILMESSGLTEGFSQETDTVMDTEDKVDTLLSSEIVVELKLKKKGNDCKQSVIKDPATEMQQNKVRKKAYKKMKKLRKKNEKNATVLSKSLESSLSFESTDFV